MREALEQAADDAGIRMTLLDTCYVSSGFGAPVEGVQVRYSDGDRRALGRARGHGPAAIHSVRAVPRNQLHVFRGRDPLHVHLSEQPRENEDCLAAYGVTPTRLLHDEGLLGPGTTAVHATHLTDDDIALLGETGTNVCLTPTTERDLADGIGPARRLHEAGCRSDRQRQPRRDRPVRGAARLEITSGWRPATWSLERRRAARHRHRGRRIAVGEPADLVTVDTRQPGTADTGDDENTRSSPPPAPTSRRWSWRPDSLIDRGDAWPSLITNIGELVTNDPAPDGLLGSSTDAALVVEGSKVAWVGAAAEAPAADEHVDAGGRAVLPGFVDSHSHLVFAGDRHRSSRPGWRGSRTPPAGSARRSRPPARRPTSSSTAHVARHVLEMRRQGTTTVEIKSGYGLTVLDEARSLAVAQQFTDETTFLGAHVVPAEYADDPAGYVDLVTGPMLEAAAPYARWIDVFCEPAPSTPTRRAPSSRPERPQV